METLILVMAVALFVCPASIVIVAVLAYLIGVYVIRPRWPEWWAQHIASLYPRNRDDL